MVYKTTTIKNKEDLNKYLLNRGVDNYIADIVSKNTQIIEDSLFKDLNDLAYEENKRNEEEVQYFYDDDFTGVVDFLLQIDDEILDSYLSNRDEVELYCSNNSRGLIVWNMVC